MINIEKIGKLRAFIVAKDDRKPVPGVRVTLMAIDPSGAIIPLATLTSDHAGYVSFSIARVVARGLLLVMDLIVEVDGDKSSHTSVGKWLGVIKPSSGYENMPTDPQPQPGCLALTVVTVRTNTTDSAGCSCNIPPTGTSVQEPDACDYELSPDSFLIHPVVMTGNGDCERIVPSSLPVNRYSIREVVIRSPKPSLPTIPAVASGSVHPPVLSHIIETINTSESLPGVDLPPVDTSVGYTPRHGLRFGELLEYEQSWFSLGHSLGEIKYSLALAPGEATQVAVIDWSRTDSIIRADQVDSTEQLRHQQGFDRQIDEAVNAALSEKQGGGSFQGGLGAAASGAIKGINLGADLALGGAVTNSWGNRDMSADSLQGIHAKVVQASTLTRSLTSTVVVQASQSERNTLSTRAVANHNHCHALTIVYYEVLRHLRVRTSLRSRRWVAMIPFAFIDFSKVDNIYRFRAALEQGLLDSNRAKGFDALERINSDDYFDWPTSSIPPAGMVGTAPPNVGHTANGSSNNDPSPSQTPVRQFEITLRTTSWNWGSTYGEIQVQVMDKQTNKWVTIWNKKGVKDNGTELNKITFPQAGTNESTLFAENLGDVQVGWKEDNGMDSWDFAGITVRYKLDKGWFTLVNEDGERISVHDPSGNTRVICNFDDSPSMIYSPTLQSNPYNPNPESNPSSGSSIPQLSSDERKQLAALRREADEGAFTRLKQHLMMNAGYYSRIVWLNMDRSERQVIMESALENHPELFQAIDDRPLAVSGNRVAFAFTGDPPAWLGVLSRETPVPEESIVTFPTPGIFAEAQLGHCNACEERDITRMWNWAELPVEQLPQMDGISPGPRGQTPSITPAQLPANVLNVMSAPSVPDPSGLVTAINAVTKGDSFRDMSGLTQVSDLLGKLASGAVDLTKGQQQLQKDAAAAKEKVDSVVARAATGAPAQAVQSPTERVDNLKAAQAVAKMAPELGWSAETTADVTRGIVAGDRGALSRSAGGRVAEGVQSSKSAALPIESTFISASPGVLVETTRKMVNITRTLQAKHTYGLECLGASIMYMIQSYGFVPPDMSRKEFQYAFTPLSTPASVSPKIDSIKVGGKPVGTTMPVDLFTKSLEGSDNPPKHDTSIGFMTKTEATLRGANWGGFSATEVYKKLPEVFSAFFAQSQKPDYEFMKAHRPSIEAFKPKAKEEWVATDDLNNNSISNTYFEAGNTLLAELCLAYPATSSVEHRSVVVGVAKYTIKDSSGKNYYLYPADDPWWGQTLVLVPPDDTGNLAKDSTTGITVADRTNGLLNYNGQTVLQVALGNNHIYMRK